MTQVEKWAPGLGTSSPGLSLRPHPALKQDPDSDPDSVSAPELNISRKRKRLTFESTNFGADSPLARAANRKPHLHSRDKGKSKRRKKPKKEDRESRVLNSVEKVLFDCAKSLSLEEGGYHNPESRPDIPESPIPIDFSGAGLPVATPVPSDAGYEECEGPEVIVIPSIPPQRLDEDANVSEGPTEISEDPIEVFEDNPVVVEDPTEDRSQEMFEMMGEFAKAQTSAMDFLMKQMAATRKEIATLENNRRRDAAAVAIRHDIVFNALRKISHDVSKLQRQGNSASHGDAEAQDFRTPHTLSQARAGSPRAEKTVPTKEDKQRGTMELLLRTYMEQMDEEKDVTKVKEIGQLCVRYAGDLIKTFN